MKAFSEASMVGALADWFAVVVLFRHPFGIPIPHTAIIPKSKDRIGSVLGNFVVKNFLTEDVIRKHLLKRMDSADAISELLVNNAGVIAAEYVTSLPEILEYVKDEDIHSIIKTNVLPHVRKINIAKFSGNILDFLTRDESFDKLSGEGLKIGRRIVRRSLPVMRRYVLEKFPVIWPEWFGKKEAAHGIARYITEKLKEQIDTIESDQNHPTRTLIRRRLSDFIDNLKTSQGYHQYVTEIMEKVMKNPVFSEYVLNLWRDLKLYLESKVNCPDEEMKQRIENAVLSIATSLKNDVSLHNKINEMIEKIALSALPHFAPAIRKMIEKTVGSWSEEQMVNTLEPAVGRDLQFIRINGTLVGGIAGLIIYSISLLVR